MIGEFITGASLLASALGGSKDPAQSQTGFNAYPQQVKDLLIEDYLPQLKEYMAGGYQAIPMKRAVNPAQDPFASQALWELQQYSDQLGGSGLFNNQQMPQQAPQADPSAGNAALAQQYLMGISGGSNPRGQWVTGGLSPTLGGDVVNLINRGISGGQYSMADLGRELAAQGFGKTQFNPTAINYNDLLKALA